MRLNTIIVIIFWEAVLCGQSSVLFNSDPLQCGAVKRSTNSVQTYCFEQGILVHNTLETLGSKTVKTVVDNVTWTLTPTTVAINYAVTDGVTTVNGSLTSIYGMHTGAVDPRRVLLLVNDAMPAESGTAGINASMFVAQQYAATRGVPIENLFHVTTAKTTRISYSDYQSQVEGPLRTYLEANGGEAKQRILYLIPMYGVPLAITGADATVLSVDSMLASMYLDAVYAGMIVVDNPYFYPYELMVPSTYAQLWKPANPMPEHFQGFASKQSKPMYLTGRLDGPTAADALTLITRSVAAETNPRPASAQACWDWQGTRHTDEWQFWIDTRIRDGAGLSFNNGYPTFLNRQASGDSISADEPPPPGVPIKDGGAMTCPNALFGFGWYNYPAEPSPYTWAKGAVASHLISCNGADVREKFTAGSCNWVAQMIRDGVTGTWGTVDEPTGGRFIQGVNVFQYMSAGYTFGESISLATPMHRWTMYSVGDPLMTWSPAK